VAPTGGEGDPVPRPATIPFIREFIIAISGLAAAAPLAIGFAGVVEAPEMEGGAERGCHRSINTRARHTYIPNTLHYVQTSVDGRANHSIACNIFAIPFAPVPEPYASAPAARQRQGEARCESARG